MDTYEIGVLLGERRNAFWMDMKRAFELQAPRFGIHAACVWPSPGDETETQLTALQEMAHENFHAMIVNPITRYNLVPGILAAARRGVPVLDVGGKADGPAVGSAGRLYVPVKTVDFYRQGELGAACILETPGPACRGSVAVVEGRADSTQSMERSRGAADTLERAVGSRRVIRLRADDERHTATRGARHLLQRHPDLSAFFCVNDHMALGVADAVEALGLRNRVTIVGVDLIDEAAQAIRAGRMNASVAFSVSDVAEVLLDATVRRMEGRTVPDGYTVTSRVVDTRRPEGRPDPLARSSRRK